MAPTPILVLGMHRSGTSCLTGSLQQRGLHLGQVYESRPHNRKGNRENQQVMDLNNAVLEASAGRWDRPPDTLRWDGGHARLRDDIVAGLQAGSGGAPWGFKDPRTLLTLPFWLEGLPDGARYVATFRHPVRVARSLRARDPAMSMDAGLALWSAYNRRLLELHAGSPFPLVSFDADAAAYRAAVDALAVHLDLPGPAVAEDLFFEETLRTQDADRDDAVKPEQLALHDALRDASSRWRE